MHPHVGKLLKGGFSGLRRLRVGNYRIIYEFNEGEVLILALRIVPPELPHFFLDHSTA